MKNFLKFKLFTYLKKILHISTIFYENKIAKPRLTALATRLKRHIGEAGPKKINILFSKEPSKV